MARRNGRRRSRDSLEDLTPYRGCGDETVLGLAPLAVGWLRRDRAFETGPVPAGFAERLLRFCFDDYVVCDTRAARPCTLCGETVNPISRADGTAHFGAAEIRVIGDEDLFAAPTQIYHYVTVHGYRPPDVFVRAVLLGPQPGSPEHRAVVKTLNRGR